jgi:hypothetical protein
LNIAGYQLWLSGSLWDNLGYSPQNLRPTNLRKRENVFLNSMAFEYHILLLSKNSLIIRLSYHPRTHRIPLGVPRVDVLSLDEDVLINR